MKSNFEPVRNWFGFSRRERRSAFILLLIIILIIALRFIVPEKNLAIDESITAFSDTESESLIRESESLSALQLFPFDPNRVPYETLLKLGFTPREARTLLNYRSKGGKFRIPSDISKVYGIEKSKAENLIPFIKLMPDTIVSDRN
jgi:competence protein ComEA